MSVVQAIVLGAVQGLTEFVPISSSGHLVLVPQALGWAPPGLAFDVMLHVASLVALLAYFARDLGLLVRGVVAREPFSLRLAGLIALATIPAAVAGLLWGDYFEEAFTHGRAAAAQLIVTAAILVAAELAFAAHVRRRTAAGVELRGLAELRWPDAAAVGIAQAVSILPGISRSGATIGAGIGAAVTRDAAAHFAFLLAIPALLGAAVVKVPDLGASSLGVGAGFAGFASSLAFSYAAIAGLLRYLKTRNLYPFALYCLVAGIAFYVAL